MAQLLVFFFRRYIKKGKLADAEALRQNSAEQTVFESNLQNLGETIQSESHEQKETNKDSEEGMKLKEENREADISGHS